MKPKGYLFFHYIYTLYYSQLLRTGFVEQALNSNYLQCLIGNASVFTIYSIHNFMLNSKMY